MAREDLDIGSLPRRSFDLSDGTLFPIAPPSKPREPYRCTLEEIVEFVADAVTAETLAAATAAAGGVVPVFEDLTPTLAETGTSWVLSSTPNDPSRVMVFLNGQLIRRVASSPGATEYTIASDTITTGHSLSAGETLEAIYMTSGSALVFDDLTPNLTETGTAWALSSTPASASQLALFLNGQRLRKVASSPGATEFTISGTTIATGHSLTAGETLEALYAA